MMRLHLNMYRLVGLAFLVVLATGCGKRTAAQEVGGMDEETRAKLELMQQQMMVENFGDIVISGQITDENGTRLNAVRVTGYYHWMNDQTVDTMKIDTMFDGVFALSITNCRILELEFKKDGYYKAELARFASDGEPDWGGRKKLEEHDVSVVLEKQGDLTVLTESDMWLQFDVSGKASVAEVGPDGMLSKTQVDDLNANGGLPEHGIYLAAETSGSVIRVVDETNRYGSVVGVNVLRGRLVMCNSQDGFVGQESETQAPRDTFRRMKQAPASGYARELAVTPRGDNFFYFKINSLYGKGCVGPRDVSSETNSCDCMLEIQLQKDGSRNLESIYY
jgi:hypothetical protein